MRLQKLPFLDGIFELQLCELPLAGLAGLAGPLETCVCYRASPVFPKWAVSLRFVSSSRFAGSAYLLLSR